MNTGITWSDIFETGIAEVDEQHHGLVDLVQQLSSGVTENTLSAKALEDLLARLADYTVYHFDEEEALMSSMAVDQRHQDRHIVLHREFVNEVKLLAREVSCGDKHAATHMINFLNSWLATHILGVDQEMAKQIAFIRSGGAPAEAYETIHEDLPSSVPPLLDALNGLLGILSGRNRELRDLNAELENKVAERTAELAEANQRLQEIAHTDAMTGLPNRRSILHSLRECWSESSALGLPCACIMIDADYFKEVNDTYGHEAGDAVLIELARALRGAIRTDDLVARLGGDEFLAVCPKTDQSGAHVLGNSILRAVKDLRVQTGEGEWVGSVSIGVAVSDDTMQTPEDLLRLADERVYTAKAAGRGCVR